MKSIQSVVDINLLGFVTSTLLRVGTDPVVKISRKPEGYLGDKVLIEFVPPSETTNQEVRSFLARLQENLPNTAYLLP